MASGRRVRINLLGSLTGTWAGETWQTGMSFVEQDSGGVYAGAIREALPSFEVDAIGEATSDATWNVDWAWKGDTKLTQAQQISVANHAVTFWNAIKGIALTDTKLDSVQIGVWGSDNKMIGGYNRFSLKTPIAGTAAPSTFLPPQLCMVTSLRTGSRGPRGRGRMYLPLRQNATAVGLISGGYVTTINAAVKAFAENVRAVGPLACVANPTPLTYSALTSVRTGNFYDTQRRRRAALDETYVDAAVTL